MTTVYYVDSAMMGDRWRGDVGALQAFAAHLSLRLARAGVPVVAIAVTDTGNGARNDDPGIVPDRIWFSTLEECPPEWWQS